MGLKNLPTGFQRPPGPRRPRRHLEEAQMRALSAWLDSRRPRVLWAHPANESPVSVGYRAKMKRLGVRAGLPDVLIFTRPPQHPDARGVAIELKAEKGRVSPAQQAWMEALTAEGWRVSVQVGAMAAVQWLQALGY